MRNPAESVERFEIAIPETDLLALKARLADTRWVERETVDDWSQGAPLALMQSLCGYWRDRYDWRRCERLLNGLGQYRTAIDGLGIHFLHIRSNEPGALPLLMTHGWPGSVVEFHKIVGPLTNPTAHGGKADEAFHLVIPSLPGFGFSDRPARTGWGVPRIAQAWTTLMSRLGYERFVAQGGDWGAAVTTALGALAPPALAAIHLNMPIAFPLPEDFADMTPAEASAAQSMDHYTKQESGYSTQQGTRPQTIGYGLVDSPVAQAAWILEKLYAWSDCHGDVTSSFSFDEMLDNIMLYWLTATGASSARLYWESMGLAFANTAPVNVPTGCSIFPKELFRPSRRWAERRYGNIVYWNELDKGGHFAAFEQPRLFVDEMRACFRQFR